MEFSQEIITVLDYVCNKFGLTIDWTSENIIPYLQDLSTKYLSYEVYTSIAWMVIMIAVTMIVAIALSALHKKANEDNWDFDCSPASAFAVVFWVAFPIMVFTIICVICTQVFDIIECYTLPEKVILEYLQVLMK